MTVTGTAILEANYYILMGTYAVPDSPTGTNLTGIVISRSCFALETAEAGAGVLIGPATTRADFSKQMDPATVLRLVDIYQVNLAELYNSSWSCQIVSMLTGPLWVSLIST
jgi:hypothetical protein